VYGDTDNQVDVLRISEPFAKFHYPIVIEPVDCWQAAMAGRFKLGGKGYPFEMNIRRSVIVDLVGGLDNNGNCEVGLYEVNGVPLKSQMATVMYEIYVRQEWVRANDLTGTIKLSEYLMGTTRDQTLVDSEEGTYVWDYSQDGCPDMLVSLYRGRIKVLTNSPASFTDGTAIVAGRDKNQVASLELKETMILCGRAAQTTHIKSIAMFFHPMEQIEVASGKFNMVTTEAEFTRLESELSFLQVRPTIAAGDNSLGEGGDMRGSEADRSHEAGEHRRGGEPLQPHAGVWERTPGHLQWCDCVCDQVPGGRGAAKDPHQLHQQDPGDPQRDECVRRPDELCDQGGAGEV
jgi:hypothetical protein